jgi:membrane protease YdiL (CAAX protease family)
LAAIALPEELFFRGYVQGRLAQVLPAGRRILGVQLGLAALLANLGFALVHLVAVPSPHRLLVFFPGLLFAWLRGRSGSAVAAAVCHACCNLALTGAVRSYG